MSACSRATVLDFCLHPRACCCKLPSFVMRQGPLTQFPACLNQAESAPGGADPALASKTPTEAAFEQHFLQNQASWAEQRQNIAEKKVCFVQAGAVQEVPCRVACGTVPRMLMMLACCRY